MTHYDESAAEEVVLRVRIHGDTTAAFAPLEQVERLTTVASAIVDEYSEPLRLAREVFQTVVQPVVEELSVALSEGSFLSDFLPLLADSSEDQARYEAARRLAARHLRPKTVEYELRWNQLEDAFYAWRGGRGFDEAWEDLVVAHIFDACGDMLDCTLGEAFVVMRRRLRSAIERDLLGRTLDSGDVAEKLMLDPSEGRATPEEILEFAELRLDFLLALEKLPAEDRILLCEYVDPSCDRRALAQRRNISYDALRQRVSRIQKTIRAYLVI